VTPRRARPSPADKLSGDEVQAVLDVLRSERFVDASPAQALYTVLDEGHLPRLGAHVLPDVEVQRRGARALPGHPPSEEEAGARGQRTEPELGTSPS
jgi:hypothetical protein